MLQFGMAIYSPESRMLTHLLQLPAALASGQEAIMVLKLAHVQNGVQTNKGERKKRLETLISKVQRHCLIAETQIISKKILYSVGSLNLTS